MVKNVKWNKLVLGVLQASELGTQSYLARGINPSLTSQKPKLNSVKPFLKSSEILGLNR